MLAGIICAFLLTACTSVNEKPISASKEIKSFDYTAEKLNSIEQGLELFVGL